MLKYNNENYCLVIDGGAIRSLTNGRKEFVAAAMPVFNIRMRNAEADIFEVNAFQMHCVKEQHIDDKFLLKYTGEQLLVDVSVQCGKQILWDISIQNKTDMVIEWVDFPQIRVPRDLIGDGGEYKILWGFNEGAEISDITERYAEFAYREPKYPGEGLMGIFPAIVQTQCMAYYNGACGLYIAAHDNAGNVKGIDFMPCGNGIKLQFRHFTGCDFGCNYIMPYSMVLQMFVGDWHDAAEIYRNWFEANKPSDFIEIEKNSVIPQWYHESPIIITYPVRGTHDMDEMKPNKLYPYENVIQHAERIAKETHSKVMVLLMHWEGTAPWAPPYVWPPYGGETQFRKFAEKLHDRGYLLGVYCSGIGWTQQSNLIKSYNLEKRFEEEGLADEMCLSPKQTLEKSHICPGQRSGYDLCPSREFTVNTIVSEVEKMVNGGVDYIQVLDQNHGGTPYFCYSKKHDHPPVPGKWQTDSMKQMLASAAKFTAPKKVLLGCESAAAESYIPDLLFSDNRYNLCYRIGRPVPLYGYLYHRYVNNFMGNQVSTQFFIKHDEAPFNLCLRLAQAFIAGDMLTLVLNQEGQITWNWGQLNVDTVPPQDEALTLVKNLNTWRTGESKKYLHLGQMKKPAEIDCEKNMVAHFHGPVKEYDSILTCCWQADDGKTGQFLVNYNDRTVDCNVSFLCDREVSVSDGNVSYMHKGSMLSVTVPPLSAILLEW